MVMLSLDAFGHVALGGRLAVSIEVRVAVKPTFSGTRHDGGTQENDDDRNRLAVDDVFDEAQLASRTGHPPGLQRLSPGKKFQRRHNRQQGHRDKHRELSGEGVAMEIMIRALLEIDTRNRPTTSRTVAEIPSTASATVSRRAVASDNS